MIQTYQENNHLIHDDYVRVFPYVIETIKQLKDKNIQIGIVTSKMRSGAIHGLTFTTLDQYIDTVVTVDDVTHSKPHPESVIKTMEQLNSKPRTTLMVGDNSHDILDGQRAGVRTAGVAWPQQGKRYV